MQRYADFLRFVRAAGRIGASSVFFAILLFTISVYEHFIGKNLSAYWFVLAAGVFFTLGAFTAWLNIDRELRLEKSPHVGARLHIELVRAFFDVSKVENRNVLQLHIYTYLRVTNMNPIDTLIKSGAIELTVEGKQYRGSDDDVSRVGNSLEHVTDFKLGGETSTEVFGNTLSRFRRLMNRLGTEQTLKQGITREGFIAFLVPELHDWNRENPYLIEAANVVLTLTDSLGGRHSVENSELRIANGVLISSGRFPL